MEIISRKEAKSLGIKRYYTGKPCPHGHVEPRYTHNGECEACARNRSSKKSKSVTKEQKKERDKKYYEKNKEKIRSKQKENYKLLTIDEKKKRRGSVTSDSILNQKTRSSKWYLINKEKQKEVKAKYLEEKRYIVYAINANRRARKKRASVLWSDKNKIKQIYLDSILISKTTGIKHHVDHIVPLKSKFVCGLHNEFNLMIITEEDNLKKGNLFWPDMP